MYVIWINQFKFSVLCLYLNSIVKYPTRFLGNKTRSWYVSPPFLIRF